MQDRDTAVATRDLISRHLDWAGWEAVIKRNGFTIERPYGTAHPRFPDIVYPIDYGYINDTLASDGVEVDLFIGSSTNALVGMMLCVDHRRGDRECKLLWNCTPEEIYLVNGFINFDRSLMEGILVLRHPMRSLWV